jgi:hypothetical protein
MSKTKAPLVSSLRFDHWGIGNWNLFGIWSLVPGISSITFTFFLLPF